MIQSTGNKQIQIMSHAEQLYLGGKLSDLDRGLRTYERSKYFD